MHKNKRVKDTAPCQQMHKSQAKAAGIHDYVTALQPDNCSTQYFNPKLVKTLQNLVKTGYSVAFRLVCQLSAAK